MYGPLCNTEEWIGLGERQKRGVMKGLFEEAGKEGSRDANRRKVFAFWKESGGAEEEESEDEE